MDFSSHRSTRKRCVHYALVFFCLMIGKVVIFNYMSKKTTRGKFVFHTNGQDATGAKQSRKANNMFLQRSVHLFDNGLQFDASFSPLYHSQQKFFDSERVVPKVYCGLLFEQNDKEIEKVRKIKVTNESQSFCQQTKVCESFIKTREYIMDPLTDERNFPIAYSILVYKSREQFEILLRSIYRPQNMYCVYMDRKTVENVLNELSYILLCFPNVKMASKRIEPVKGSVHVTLNRKVVEYVINNDVAADFLTWVNKTSIPDETFFATLIHNPQLGIPGSFKGDLETDCGIKKPFLSRFVNWAGLSNSPPCHGKYVRSVCVFGVGDLSLLARRPDFFTNKFYTDYQEAALLCIDQLIYNRTRNEYYQRLEFDLQYYEKLPHIRNIV